MRKGILAFLIILIVLVSGCLGGGSTSTTSSSPSKTTPLATKSPIKEKPAPLKFLYPESPKVVNWSYEEAYRFFANNYSKVPYSQYGNITVNYSDGTFHGRYEFVLTNFTSGVLYLARLVTPKDPLTLKITIGGVPLNLSRVNAYRWTFSNGAGIEFYAVNVSTNLTELHGVATYEFRYLPNEDYIFELISNDIHFGTDFSWWEFASRNVSVKVLVRFPENTIFVLFGYGIVRSGMEVTYDSASQGGFILYLPNLEWKTFEIGGTNYTVYFPSDKYSEEGFNILKAELAFAMNLYANMTGISPARKFDVVFYPDYQRMMYKRFGSAPFAVNRGHVIIVNCPVDIRDSAVNYASVIFHEVAHEWAGYYARFRFIHEPLATFMQMEAYGKWDPEGYPLWLDNNEHGTVLYGNTVSFYELLHLIEERSRSSYSSTSWRANPYFYTLYWKGAFVIRSLRLVIGEEKFSKGFKELFHRCHDSWCNVTDFQRTFEDVSGENLTWFFNEWFNSTLVPDYNVTNLSVESNGNGYTLTFTITDVSNFTMPVPIRIYLEDGSHVDRTVWVNDTATVNIELPQKPVEIVIDPNEVMVNVNREFEVDGIKVRVN
ncbi:hypothetical protein A3L11_02675 [Thermococcus siculi]|uniref:Peptidase M1 membrane alanine aminopeptidase domain-containing protein n=1 Tax=Thermococcus siculi TaxID=72803 RepID=A0A2Z2MNH0_9EURY|nr:M1 family aminopeptidase [Thermococcus siculi]ASJ08187.1 hypothetical protein A3L11_02675 [Thermococcus siculi]